MSWSAVWDLPAPVGRVLVTESALRHCFNRHTLNSWEPWNEFLGGSLSPQFHGCWNEPSAARRLILDEIAALMGESVRRAIERPLFLSHEQHALLYLTYEIITRSGLLVVIRQRGGQAELKTAFFPYAACSERPSRRWKGTVRSRVELYAVLRSVDGKPEWSLPTAAHEVPLGDPHGFRRNIKFESLHVWDFREVVLPDRDGPLILWGTRPLGWPTETETEQKMADPFPLKKRKRGGGTS